MGIFSKKQNRVEEQPTVTIERLFPTVTEQVHCLNGHTIDGIEPKVNAELLELQNPQFIGRVCDCKLLKYEREEKCGCSIERWQIVWSEAN